jgi:low affinity Fe/Cu permease
MYVYTGKGYVYAVLVFFSSVFIVIQLGLQGVEMANFGGNERVIATVAGIIIAFVTIVILQAIVKRDTLAPAAVVGQT